MEKEKRNNFLVVLGWSFVGLFLVLLALGFSKRGMYSSTMGINLIVVGDNGVALLLLRPKEEMMTWVRIPNNLSIKISGSSAVYPLESLWKYGVMEKNPYRIVSQSLSAAMGVLLPKTIKIKGDPNPENLLGGIHKIGLQTDLSIRDRVLIRRDLSTSVASKRYLEIDIPKSAMTKAEDPDGKEFLEVNNVVNLWTKNKFIFDSLLGETANIKIYNLSGKNGLGLLLSRQLESSGLRVVEVASVYSENITGKGCLYHSDVLHPETEYLLDRYVGCKKKESSEKGIAKEGIEVWLF